MFPKILELKLRRRDFPSLGRMGRVVSIIMDLNLIKKLVKEEKPTSLEQTGPLPQTLCLQDPTLWNAFLDMFKSPLVSGTS